MNKNDETMMTVTEAAAFLRVSKKTIYESLGRGELPGRKVGSVYRIPRSKLIATLDGDRSPEK